MLTLVSINIYAQKEDDWKPTGVWPFIHQKFYVATVSHGFFKTTKTQVPCNIHIGKNTLWFSKNDTLMEALPGNVKKIEFENETYIPVKDYLGRIVKQDTLQGKIARLLHVVIVDQHKLDQQGVDVLNKTQNILQSSGFLSTFCASIADANGGLRAEEMPVPTKNVFYIQFNGDIFEATTKNILAHIRADRQKEYKAYTRSAEIISTNESSMVKVWNDFFVNYDKPNRKQ